MTLTSSATDRVVVLVERIQAGTDYEGSCRELYQLFRRRISSFFAARGFSFDECAGLTQETFIRVFLGIGRLHSASRFATWLFEIADLLGISIETVKAHLHQAQKRLKVAFSDPPDEESQGAL